MTKTIFISHATKDDAEIDKIYDLLTAAGFGVWVDHKEGIPLGVGWDSAIRKGIAGCDIGVFVMSANALASEICGSECLLVRELKKPLYILRLSEVDPEHVWLYIKQIQYADMVKDFEGGVQRLARTLNGSTMPDEKILEPLNAPITGIAQLRTTLPYLTPLRGRDEDLNQLRKTLGAHVVQIVGTGGLGKSRLVAELALNYPNGTIWHRCASTSQSAEVIELVRQHFNLPDDAKPSEIFALLRRNVPLIVLDNAEDIAPKGEQRQSYLTLIAELNAHGAPLVMTSRKVWDELKPRRELTPRALNLEYAAALAEDFATSEKIELTDEQTHDLAQKARLYPRLIEWAVGQLHERDFARVTNQLTELKQQSIKEALDEMIHKTIRQMVQEVANGAQAEALLRNITIFRGKFTQEAASAVQPESISDEDGLDEALVTLQKWRFVRRDEITSRCHVDELVREVVGQADESLFPRYVDFYIIRAEQFAKLQSENWERLAEDLTDITYVGDELVKRTEIGTTGDLLRALAFAYNTTHYLAQRREVHRFEWLEMGLNAARTLQNDVDSTDIYRRRESLFLNELGLAWSGLGEKRKALEYYEQALILRRMLGHRSSEATTLSNIGLVWSDLGDKQKALEYYEQALLLKRATGASEATTLNNIASAWSDLGDKQKALEYYNQALLLRRAIGNRGDEANTLTNIGMIWSDLGDKHKALAYSGQALQLYRLVGERDGEATTLNNIGAIWSDLGDKQKALEYYEQALLLKRIVGDRSGEATTLNNIAHAYYELGDRSNSLEYLKKAINLFKDTIESEIEVNLHANIGALYKELGNLNEAIAELREAITILRRSKLPYAAGGVSVEIYETNLRQWETQRDNQSMTNHNEVTNAETAQLFDMLAQVYRAQGEDAVRAILKQSTLEAAAVEEMIAQVKAMVSAAPEESPQEKMAKAFNSLVQLYRSEGEARARAALQASGLPDPQISQLMEQVKQKAASEQ